MAWPEKISSIHINFPEKFLPVIMKAVENQRVKWTNSSMFAESFIGEFEWANNKWKIEEFVELVTSINVPAPVPVSIHAT